VRRRSVCVCVCARARVEISALVKVRFSSEAAVLWCGIEWMRMEFVLV
jgi:hypothetical protein